MSKAKFIGLICCLCIIGIGVFLVNWSQSSQEGIIHSQLSERAKEFAQQNPELAGFSVEEESEEKKLQKELDQQVRTACFSFRFPFEVTLTKIEDGMQRCVVKTTTKKPVTRITISQDIFEATSLQEQSGVIMRIRDPSTYTDVSHLFPQIQNMGQDTGIVFASHNEITVFVKRDNTILTISVYDFIVADSTVIRMMDELINVVDL